ncbi:twin-arginine translocase subunit TatC [Halocatena marina]
MSRWKLVVLGLTVLLLFLAGMAYSYYLFFPLLFEFLSSNTAQSGLEAHYSFVSWFRFLALLSLAIGSAAELPLVMSLLTYTEVVRYEIFRDKWRYAVVIIFVLGALFSPPDPFTQILMAIPLLSLYVFSLFLSRFVITIKYSSDEFGLPLIAYKNGHIILSSALLTGMLAYQGVVLGYGARANAYLQQLPYNAPELPSVEWLFALPREPATIVFGVTIGSFVAAVVFLIQLFRTIDPTDSGPSPASTGDPSSLDLSRLDANSIAVAPAEAFTAMTEDEALGHAGAAMDANDPEKAQAILNRFDAAQEYSGNPTEAGAAAVNDSGHGGTPANRPPAPQPGPNESAESNAGDVVTETTTGMVNAFTDNERSEDDIGGYFYDIQFILGSLTSKMFRIVGLFMLVMGVIFTALYKGGLTILKEDFLSRLPAGVRADQVGVVALHPVEALVFDVKLAAVIALATTLPAILYYAWPALAERGLVGSRAGGGRGILFMWSFTSLIVLLAGSVLGYAVVAPTIISWLAYDAIQANMLIKYQINSAGWLVFFTTIGIGLLATIPTTLLFLHRGGFLPYRLIIKHWREAVVIIIGVIAVAAPGGVFGMLIFSLPVVGAYLIGLILLWLYTFGGRRHGPLTKSRRV